MNRNDVSYDYSMIVPSLVTWYTENARILPWRMDPSPYHVWVSEIMLQQTRVEAVKGYYERFLEILPTIKDLAEAPEDILLKLWEGLGYYTRVRNLQKAAQIVVRDYNGCLPADDKELLKLPGIGSYTAGAIASIAYGIPVAAVDGNVLRIAKRIEGSFEDITKAKVKKQLEIDLSAVVPKNAAGAFNQSLMDLGATICIPNGKPLCEKCPINNYCEAYKQGIQMQIPVKTKKKARRVEEKTILVLEWRKQYLIRKRENSGLLAGLYELPSFNELLDRVNIEERLHSLGLLTSASVVELGSAKHIFSHVEWRMKGYHIKFTSQDDLMKFCGQLYEDKPVAGDNLSRETSNYVPVILAGREELRSKFSLPSAFDVYKIWKKYEKEK